MHIHNKTFSVRICVLLNMFIEGIHQYVGAIPVHKHSFPLSYVRYHGHIGILNHNFATDIFIVVKLFLF